MKFLILNKFVHGQSEPYRIRVNMELVASYHKYSKEEFTRIITINDKEIQVKETPEKIDEMVNKIMEMRFIPI